VEGGETNSGNSTGDREGKRNLLHFGISGEKGRLVIKKVDLGVQRRGDIGWGGFTSLPNTQ